MIVSQRSHEIEDLFYSEEMTWSDIAKSLRNSEEIHHSLSFYNWDDGFEFPRLLLNRADCDLGTILLMFEMIEQDPELPCDDSDFSDRERDLKIFYHEIQQRWEEKDYSCQISHRGSPGEPLEVEWKRRYQHYDVYPDEK